MSQTAGRDGGPYLLGIDYGTESCRVGSSTPRAGHWRSRPRRTGCRTLVLDGPSRTRTSGGRR